MLIRKFLLPLSPIYGLIMQIRNKMYDTNMLMSYQADIPVVSVGNISTGGTGKTPIAEYLLSVCRDLGVRAAYLSRGYGRKSKGYLRVDPQMGNVKMFGDEALQVASKFPTMAIAVCEDRKTGIKRLKEDFRPDIVILDDAFQHRRVKRDLDIVVIDANRLPNYDKVLPAGNLREFKSGLKRADLLVINKITQEEQIHQIAKRLEPYTPKSIAYCKPCPSGVYKFSGELMIPNKDLAGKSAIVFSGIGNNVFFQQQLKNMEIDILATKKYSDHYPYKKKDISFLIQLYREHKKEGSLLLTTEKDFFRMKDLFDFETFPDVPFAYIPIGLKWFRGEENVREAINPFLRVSTP